MKVKKDTTNVEDVTEDAYKMTQFTLTTDVWEVGNNTAVVTIGKKYMDYYGISVGDALECTFRLIRKSEQRTKTQTPTKTKNIGEKKKLPKTVGEDDPKQLTSLTSPTVTTQKKENEEKDKEKKKKSKPYSKIGEMEI